MSLGKAAVVSSGEWIGSDFSVGRLLSTAALVGMGSLTAPEATTLGIGRYVVPDILNNRIESAANRAQDGGDTVDAANFLLPGTAGATGAVSNPASRDGGVLLSPTLPGVACRIQTFGICAMLGTLNGVSGNILPGDFIGICDATAAGAFVNTRGAFFSLTPNATTGVLTGPSAAVVGVTNGNTYSIIGQVLQPVPAFASANGTFPGTAGTNAVPQLYRVRLFGNNGACRTILGTA